MHASNFDEALDQIIQKDPRYQREAYSFVREALDYTQKMVAKTGRTEARKSIEDDAPESKVRHVSGHELLSGLRAYALDQFGPMALTVLREWGVRVCEDFGEIVFNMVEHNLLAKTKKDSREDFKGGYEFEEAFRKPFLPENKKAGSAKETKPN